MNKKRKGQAPEKARHTTLLYHKEKSLVNSFSKKREWEGRKTVFVNFY